MVQQKAFISSLNISICLALIFVFGFNPQTARACTPLAVPALVNQAFSGNSLLLDWNSTNSYSCPGYSVEIEIACQNGAFTGTTSLYLSASLNKTTTPQAFPQVTVNTSAFCPGTVYMFRARERSGAQSSAWSSTFTFTTPGTYQPVSLNVTASSNIICPPQTAQLNANIINACGAPYTYVWSPATGLSSTTIANPVANPTASTVYTVVVSSTTGCWTSTGTINITTGVATPAVGTGSASPAIICTGLSTTLILSSYTGNIQWQTAPTGAGPWTDIPGGITNSFVTAPMTSNACFKAIVSTCSGTLVSNIFCVNVDPYPVLTPTVMQISCSNTVATANIGNQGSSGPFTVTWSPLPISYGSQSASATYTTPGVANYTVVFSDGCVASNSLNILPPPPHPTFNIVNVTGSPSITCTYSVINLLASNNYTYGSINYFWASTSFTAATQSVTITNPGTYTVTLTDPATNCTEKLTIPIYLNNTAPTLSLSPITQSIGCGPGVVATATGVAISPSTNVTHSWWSPGVPVPYTFGGPYSIFSPIPGTSTFVLTDNINGCSTSKTLQVVSVGGAYPTFDLTSASITFSLGCSTKTITDITVANANTGGAVNYTMLPPGYSGGLSYSVGLANVFYVTTPGSYTVIVRNPVNSCETRVPVSVLQNTFAPSFSVTAPTQTLSCYTPSVILSASSTVAPVSYTWSFQNGANPNTQPTSTVVVPTTTAGASVPSGSIANTYSLTVEDGTNLCLNHTVVTMYQNTRPPIPQIIGTASLTCKTGSVSLGTNSKTGILPNTFPAFQNVLGLKWEGPTPQIPKDSSSTYLAYVVGTYTLTALDLNNGCRSQTTAIVPENRNYPVITVKDTYSLDCGNSSLTITATFVPTTGLTYQWNVQPGTQTGALNQPVLLTNSTGEYQIVATDNVNGCSSYSLVNVVPGQLNGGFEADVTSGFAPLTVNFTNTSASSANSASITSFWSFGNGTTRTTTTNVPTSAIYTAPGTFTVSLFVVKGGCLDTVYKVITVDIPSHLEVPNVFTPNGDNSNDIFFVKTANLDEIDAQIYDRWGNTVYELKSTTGNIAWDGKNQAGKEVPAGTYFYVIKAKGRDGQDLNAKGPVSLYR